MEARTKRKVEVERKKSKEMIAYPILVNCTKRSLEDVVQAPLIMYLVVPTTEVHQHLRFDRVDDDNNHIIVEIDVCKCKK